MLDWKIKTSSHQPSTGVVVWQIIVYNLQLLDCIRLSQNNNNGTEKERELYGVGNGLSKHYIVYIQIGNSRVIVPLLNLWVIVLRACRPPHFLWGPLIQYEPACSVLKFNFRQYYIQYFHYLLSLY